MKISLILFVFFVPQILFAQEVDPDYIINVLVGIQGLIKSLAPLLIGVAVVVFFWGVVRYIKGAYNPDERIAGRGLMIYGVISLFVIVSIWGLVSILQTLTGTEGLGLGDVGVPVLPSPDSM